MKSQGICKTWAEVEDKGVGGLCQKTEQEAAEHTARWIMVCVWNPKQVRIITDEVTCRKMAREHVRRHRNGLVSYVKTGSLNFSLQVSFSF